MPIPFNKMFFAQNVMPAPLPDPPDPDPDDPDLSGCAIDTNVHPRWDYGGVNNYGSDWFGFKATPGGARRNQDGSYSSLGYRGYWWSATEPGGQFGWLRIMASDNGEVKRTYYKKGHGHSVLCVKDTASEDPDGTIYTDDYEDGSENQYDGVKIGNQIWTTKNLIATDYQNGDPITTGLNDTQWGETITGAYAIYPHAQVDGIASEQAMIDAYGLLYNWYAVDNDLVDDNDYRVPTDEDWTALTDYLIDEYGLSESNVAMVLKSCRVVNHPLA